MKKTRWEQMISMIGVFSAMAVMALFNPAMAATDFKVATGGAKGTYSTMFGEMKKTCPTPDLNLIEVNTTGSNDNLSLLAGNQVNAVFTQTDVLFFRAGVDDMSKVRTLVALHPEEIHVVSATAGKLEGDTFGYGGTRTVFTDVQQLTGRKVAAAGGAITTANVIRLQGKIDFEVLQMKSNEESLAAVAAGTADAAILVGGSPLPLIDALGPDMQLMFFSPEMQTRLGKVYRPARVSYQKMGAAGVSTIATDALFVSREYKTPKMVAGLKALRHCLIEAVPELQETTGTHPKWMAVDPTNKGKWEWMDL